MKYSLIMVLVLLAGRCATACTAFFVKGSPTAVIAKNLDWYSGLGAIYINKRHVQKRSVFVVPQIPLSWTSTLMSVTYTQSGRDFPWEGMNEAGLSVHGLQLLSSVVPPTTDPRPAVEFVEWMQYILDTSGTVNEAIVNAQKTRVAPSTTVHYFLCDASSACAVLEYLGGQLVVHQSGNDLPYPAISNNTYADSLNYLQTELGETSAASILTKPSFKSLDRFARAALWSQNFSPAENAVNYAFAGLRNAWESDTFWMMVHDLKARVAYLSTAGAPAVKWIDLSKFQPGCASGTEMLDINAQISGDASAYFTPYSAAQNLAVVNQNTLLTPGAKAVIGAYPETYTHCTED
jgi:penicillin V acylase-like amidase (Ntn superfamily)